MRLYKFRKVDTYSLSGLSNKVLWFSDLKDFNDPFEGSYILDKKISPDVEQTLLACLTTDRVKLEQMYERYSITDSGADKKKLINKVLRIEFEDNLVMIIHKSKAICMSLYTQSNDPLYENLMWSHYADGLKGYCMIFDGDKLQDDFNRDDLIVRPINVEYQDIPVTLSLNDFARSKHVLNSDLNINAISDITKSIGTKSNEWKYEKEFRFLSLEQSNTHRYSPDTLREIVIGCRMPSDQQKLVIETAKSSNPDIIIKFARLKKDSYELEIVDYLNV